MFNKEIPMKNIYQHGEIILYPVKEMPKEGKPKKSAILAHSETSHHHVLETTDTFSFLAETATTDLHVELHTPASLVHKKLVDFHPTLTIEPGIYKEYKKFEYNPWTAIIQEVRD